MVEYSNQIVIEKVANGFIVALQVKGSGNVNPIGNIFGMTQSNTVHDKIHLVARSEEEVVKLITERISGLKNPEEVCKLVEEERKLLETEEVDEED